MPKIHLSRMAMAVSILLILLNGCASSRVEPSSSQVKKPGAIFVEQAPITNYMRSQVGTPNELSPIAPAEGRNVRKAGDRWFCDINGQVMGFNSANSCWEPQ